MGAQPATRRNVHVGFSYEQPVIVLVVLKFIFPKTMPLALLHVKEKMPTKHYNDPTQGGTP